MKIRRWTLALGVALVAFATTAAALSLGRMRGAVLLGRGLDVSVQGILEAQEALPEVNCLTADIFYGENRVSPSLVSISPERAASGEVRIRLRSSAIVDEPVVTVYLRSSCGASVSRRYVLLADTLSEAEQPSVVIAPAVLPRPAPAQPLPAATNSPTAASVSREMGSSNDLARERAVERAAARAAQREARRLQGTSANPPSAQAEPALAKPSADARPRTVVRKQEPARSGKPRLQLDLLDLTSADLNLRGSVELSTEPSTDAAVRSQAQALWRALNASPEDALRDAQRLEKLEAQMLTALEQGKRQGQDIASLTTELQAAQRARYFNPFTLFLGLLMLAAVGLSIWLWRKKSGNDLPWWRGASAQDREHNEEQMWKRLDEESQEDVDFGLASDEVSTSRGSQGAGQGVLAKGSLNSQDKTLKFAERPTGPVAYQPETGSAGLARAKIQPIGTSALPRGGNMGRVDGSPPPSLMLKPAGKKGAKSPDVNSRAFGHSDFAQSNFASSRLVATEELFDVQEQADFFMSLDQPEQAIEVLKNHITDNVETSALAYMDLFDIYFRIGREAEYQQLREEFNRVFNAQVPQFASYSDQSMGLEEYPDVLEVIQVAWRRPQEALEVIEESIFRQPDAQQHPFDMLAYRELMLLYAMTKDLVKTHSADSMLPSMSAIQSPYDSTPGLPDLNLSMDLDLLGQSEDQLKSDQTIAIAPAKADNGEELAPLPPTLDFDLSDMDGLDALQLPGAAKKR